MSSSTRTRTARFRPVYAGRDLEERCVRPGLWVIEGFQVERMDGWVKKPWRIRVDNGDGEGWQYWGSRPTLTECRELIADRLETR